MKINEIVSEAVKQRLDAKCWKGKHKEGTKIKGGVRVNNCVPNESVKEAFSQAAADRNKLKYQKQGRIGHGVGWKPMSDSPHEIVNNIVHQFDNISRMVAYDSASDRVKHSMVDRFMRKYGYPLELFPDVISGIEAKLELNEDWNKVNHHDKTDGLSQKAVNAYRREHPGSKLKTAVTTKPSKLKAGSKDAKRRKSFCARMSGNKGPMKDEKGRPTPKAKALSRWHCESLDQLYITANQRIYEAEGDATGLKHLTPHLARDILDQIEKEGVHAIVKSIEWGDGGAKELIAMIKRDLEQIADNASESITTNDIHALADSKGVKWDNEPNFLKLTKRLTGKEHLDDLDQAGLEKIKQHLEKLSEGKEQFNYELTQKGFHFEQEINGVTYRVSNKKGGSDNINIEALDDKGQSIGFARFWMHQYKDGLESLSTQVRDDWQGKGIAANMYAVMRMLGVNIHPASTQSDDGKKMWNKWNQQGDAQHIKSMNAKMQENFADGKHPEDKGDSARAGIPKHASISSLRKIAKQGGRKGQLAHWQANMRSGHNK